MTARPEEPATSLSLLCVHPHPDDETIAAGGTIARYLDEGARVKVVTCTRGEAGENLAGIDLGGQDLTTVRGRELEAALRELGGPEHEYLGYRDSGMAGTTENEHPDSFHQAGTDEAAARLATIIRRSQPNVVLSDDAHGTYGHPDHIKANRVTARACELAADVTFGDDAPWFVDKRYTVAFPRRVAFEVHIALVEAGLASPFGDLDPEGPEDLPFGTPDDEIDAILDVRPWLDRKRAALERHASQVGPESFFFNLPPTVTERFFGTEAFTLVVGPPTGGIEDDLFRGVR